MPAAAVRRRVLTLLGITGRKARVGNGKRDVKALGSTKEEHFELLVLSTGEGGRIPGVEVKFVDIWRNTGGEGGLLDRY